MAVFLPYVWGIEKLSKVGKKIRPNILGSGGL